MKDASLLGVIVGGFITLFVTLFVNLYVEYWKHKRWMQENVYAPLTKELRQLHYEAAKFGTNFHKKNWDNLNDKNIVFRIRPFPFQERLNKLYMPQLHNYFAGNRVMYDVLYKQFSDYLDISHKKIASKKYVENYLIEIAKMILEIPDSEVIDHINNRFTNFKDITKIPYENYSDLISALKPIVDKNPLVASQKEKRKEVMHELSTLIEYLRKKLKISHRVFYQGMPKKFVQYV